MIVALPGLFSYLFFQNHAHMLLPTFPLFRPVGMVGETCLPSNAYYPLTPANTLYSGAHICWSDHSDSSFLYGFMSLDYGLGTMTSTTTCISKVIINTRKIDINLDISNIAAIIKTNTAVLSYTNMTEYILTIWQDCSTRSSLFRRNLIYAQWS